MNEAVKVFADGGARGNPGPAAVGAVIYNQQGTVIGRISQAIGEATNNVAEYRAVIAALEWIKAHPQIKQADFFLDSTLVVGQLGGQWKIKKPHLQILADQARSLIAGLKVSFTAVLREKNSLADQLVNQALDKC